VPKTTFGYAQFFADCWRDDLCAIVRRDRNHPCVVLWSIGNEIREHCVGTEGVGALTRQMVETIHSLDMTRPVTAGLSLPSSADASGVIDALDVVGLNYNADWYAKLRGRKPVFGSETAPSLADRDTYLFEEHDGRMVPVQAQGHRECAYSPRAFDWAAPAETALRAQIDSPWSAGEFAWCTFDYLGEPNHTGRQHKDYWPARSSYWGICDLAGLPKDRYYLYRSLWNAAPTVHLMPDWTHPGCEGKIFPVWCYTNAAEAELFLNGRSQGVRRFADTTDLHLSWDVAYEPGILEVRARQADGTILTARQETAGAVAALRRTPIFESDGVRYFRFDAVDAKGVRVLSCEEPVEIEVRGGEFVCAVSGSPTDHTPFSSQTRRLFRGSLVVVARGASASLDVDCRFVRPPSAADPQN
jgi:beta-galactosidase